MITNLHSIIIHLVDNNESTEAFNAIRELFSIDQDFPLDKGWTLKENIKLVNKGDMHACLEKLAVEEELTLEEIPTTQQLVEPNTQV
ncbi:hypothetical protein RCL_jg13664.t1 [Rhizophagus clarus]|uniref:Uncharacterized protein n=1 Tax=Rhizophagus clarus TaxID=94130 RepID=A0A8H3R7A4_9GLOM|nr:hypothetical protein RCL_jg13664.t1 [Rhizophagus clarus]